MKALIAILIILTLGCIGGNPLPKDIRGEGNGSKYMDPDECEKKETGKFRDLCYANTAPQLNDLSLCDRIKDARYREVCIGRVGVATNNPALCDRIGDRKTRQECHLTLQQKNKGIL